jgi:hypothetical protein
MRPLAAAVVSSRYTSQLLQVYSSQILYRVCWYVAVVLQIVGEESGADCSSLSSMDTPAWPAGKEPVAKLRFQVRAILIRLMHSQPLHPAVRICSAFHEYDLQIT